MITDQDREKLLIAELRLGILVSGSAYTWTHGSPAYHTPSVDGEIVAVEENGAALVRAYNDTDCKATASTFFYDMLNGILWVHTSSGASPATFTTIAYFWLCLSNRPGVKFTPPDALYDAPYMPYLRGDSIPNLTQSVADFYQSAVAVQFGSISCINKAGFFWANRMRYLWNNKDLTVYFGYPDDDYEDLTLIFSGRIRQPAFTDGGVTFDVRDVRWGALREIPLDKFDATTYANIDSNAVGKPNPILFGEVANITPVCISSVSHTYKVSQTAFDGLTFPLEAITHVYKAGVALTVTTDYTVNLTNGDFTLTATPGASVITCDAKGLRCGYNLATGASTGLYSESAADVLFFILSALNGVPSTAINLDSFQELGAFRTQKIAWYIDTVTQSSDYIRALQQSALFNFAPLMDGLFAAICYRRSVPTDAPRMITQHFNADAFKIYYDAGTVYKNVIVRYAKDPTTNNWQITQSNTVAVEYEHDEVGTLTIDTVLRTLAEAETIRDFYVSLVSEPGDKVEFETNQSAIDFYPTQKIILARTVKPEGTDLSVLNGIVYRILETRKNLSTGAVGITAQLDAQASSYSIYADVDHQDYHGDHTDTGGHSDSGHSDTHSDYSDTEHADSSHEDSYTDHADNSGHLDDAHGDTTHIDAHTDSHGDVTHQDAAHTDVAHVDAAHIDGTVSYHADVPHQESAHVETAHEDAAHQETGPHSDVAHIDTHTDHSTHHQDGEYHTDSYSDTHGDVTHQDFNHTDTPHYETAHGDQAYSDVTHSEFHADYYNNAAHGDSHTDTAHLDVTHSDTHSETHGDSHTDDAHADHTDYLHTDSHTDGAAQSHTDYTHEDSYSDVGHQDHTDAIPHSDDPHGDSHTDTYLDGHFDVFHVDIYSDGGPYADSAHADSPHDDSIIHINTAHQDYTSHYNDHQDGEAEKHHSDYTDQNYYDSHIDQAAHDDHGDHLHQDANHADFHSDHWYQITNDHSDVDHYGFDNRVPQDYTDTEHVEYPYGDWTHNDTSTAYADYTDHGQVIDHSDGAHNEAHHDYPYGDTPALHSYYNDDMNNEHGDVGHADSPYLDHADYNHVDFHGDVEHEDSSV